MAKTLASIMCLMLVIGLFGVAPASAAAEAPQTTSATIAVGANGQAIELVDHSSSIAVMWRTVSEVNSAAFNLYRSTVAAAPQTLLAHVPSQAPGSAVGFAYSHEDLDVQPGQTYHYWLEEVSLSGATTLHGPVSVTVQEPTAVTLLSFTATAQPNSVLVEWETASEVDNAAFHLLRSDTPDGSQTLLAVIPSQGPGSIQGFAYSYEDLDVQPGQTYYYWLRDISLSGGSMLFGPVTVYFGGPTSVALAGLDTGVATPPLPAVAAGLAALAGLAMAGGVALRRRQRRLS